jgi:hypothetical protein
VVEDLRRTAAAGQARRPWFILGEPGAGKSTLLEHWFETWVGELPEPRLGLTVPVLVRLRELRPGDLDGDPDAAADRLWREHGAIAGAARSASHQTGESTYRTGHARAFQPVWLLDGLDELDEPLRGEARLFERLVVLPGAKLITCRTAVFEGLRDSVEPYKGREFVILPLKPNEQQSFLSGALKAHGHDPARAEVVHNAVQSNAAVRALASNPLMLGLMAELFDRIALPTTRAAYYREVVEAMWHRKLPRGAAERLLDGRDHTLAELAKKMALDRVEYALVNLLRTTQVVAVAEGHLLRDALERAGLLRVDSRRGVFSFLHLTFQEFYLARALEPGGLRRPLEQHWSDARYEETLALLASLLLEAKRAVEVDKAVCWLLEWSSLTHRRDRRLLWKQRRSPLRVALHLLRRAGASWGELPRTTCWLEAWLRYSPLGRRAIAGDDRVPTELLTALARDDDEDVRKVLAWNPAVPAGVFAALARDDDVYVRWHVAASAVTPGEVLAAFARDDDSDMRQAVADNPATPAEVLAALARDDGEDVRMAVAGNFASPAEVLAVLARDDDEDVRKAVADNRVTPPEVLAALARDNELYVRMTVAENPVTPHEVLAALARDYAVFVRWRVARHPNTPVEVLAVLARDDNIDMDFEMRRALGDNPATPPEVIAALALDDTGMRRRVANEPTTPAEVLAALASDGDEDVRMAVAGNFASPAEVLASLARDDDENVRKGVASNPATPAEVLAGLARDDNEYVRTNVASNPATPVEVLAGLTLDAESVRAIVRNPNVLLEDLAPQGVAR